MNNPCVTLFGEVLADCFPDHSVLGGAPYNVARHLRQFGLDPLLISRVGRDALAKELLAEMATLGIDSSGLQRDPQRPTGQVRVEITGDRHRFDILPQQAYDHICPQTTLARMAPAGPRYAYFGTLALRAPQSREAARVYLQEAGCPRFLDVNLRPPWVDAATLDEALQAADIVKLNDEELDAVADQHGLAANTAVDRARALQQRYGLQQVLVTCGAAGSWMLDRSGTLIAAGAPQQAIEVVDSVGAGDAWAAVYLLGLIAGWDSATTLQRAGEYSAAQCTVRGAAPAKAAWAACRIRWELD